MVDDGAWERMAEWWDGRIQDDGDLWHRALIDPVLLAVLGDTRDLDVLDLACGNGYLARHYKRNGARVVGVDASAQIIKLARNYQEPDSRDIPYHVADAAHLEMLEDDSFDVVFSNMAIMDIEDAQGAFHEAARVLRPGGRLVFSITHPCFEIGSFSGWQFEKIGAQRTIWRKVSHYREPRQHTFFWRLNPDQPDTLSYTPAYHRPLSWYVRALRTAGFVVTAFEEPMPTAEFLMNDDEGRWINEVPLHCVIEAVTSFRNQP